MILHYISDPIWRRLGRLFFRSVQRMVVIICLAVLVIVACQSTSIQRQIGSVYARLSQVLDLAPAKNDNYTQP